MQKFTKIAFEAYLSSGLNLAYSKSGLIPWLSALDTVGLIKLDKDFISLEGIAPPWEEKDISAGKQSTDESKVGAHEETAGPIAPTPMSISANFDLDYRLAPDIYRETLKWLEKMRAMGVPIAVAKKEQEKQSTAEKETDQD